MNPKILLLDIETAPVLAHVWDLWDQNIALNQIERDWFMMSFAAKWYESASGELFGPHKKVIYKDLRGRKLGNDKPILQVLWNLLDECDIILTQNGKKFDAKKINARFILNGMKPPSNYKVLDTYLIAKKHFGFTSNKLEYMTDKLCKKFKKSKHKKFSGFELWKECLKGNKEAWKEMEQYNVYDILSLEELFHKLYPWDNGIDFNVYRDAKDFSCNCGSKKFQKRGFSYTKQGKFQRYICKNCYGWSKSKTNLIPIAVRKNLKTT